MHSDTDIELHTYTHPQRCTQINIHRNALRHRYRTAHLHTSTAMHTDKHTQKCTQTHIYNCTQTHIHSDAYRCTFTEMRNDIHTEINIDAHADMHSDAHTHTEQHRCTLQRSGISDPILNPGRVCLLFTSCWCPFEKAWIHLFFFCTYPCYGLILEQTRYFTWVWQPI